MSGGDSPTFFHGQPWSSWIERIGRDKPLSDEETDAQPSNSVTRLSAEDIDLYGFCPERDAFYGVVCEICNAIVKPQALIQHMESRHPSGTPNFPPPTTPTATKPPVKTPYCKVSKLKKTQSSPQAATTTKINHTTVKRTADQANVSPSLPTTLPLSSSPRSPIESIPLQNSNSTGSTVSSSPVKSPGTIGQSRRKRLKTDRSLLKDREYDPDRHCGVWNDETGKPCTRSLTCKAHTVSLRRTVIGRSKTFDKLLAEHRASKELPNRPTKLTLTGTVTLSSTNSTLNRSLTHNLAASTTDTEAPSSPPVLSLPDTYPLPKAVDLLYRCLAPHGSTKPTKFEDDFANEELRSLESSLVNSTGSSQSSTTMAPISVVLPSLSPLPSTAEDSPTLTLVSSPASSAMPVATAAALPTTCATHTLQPPTPLAPTATPASISVQSTTPMTTAIATATATGTATTPTTLTLTPTACTTPTSSTMPTSASVVTPLAVTTVLETAPPIDVDSQAAMSLYSPLYKDTKSQLIVQIPRVNNTVHSPVSRSYQVQASMPSLSIFESVDQVDSLDTLEHLEQRHAPQINGKRLNHVNHTGHLGLVQRKSKKAKHDFQQDLSTAIQVEATTTSSPYPHFGEISWSNCHPEPLAVTRWLRISSSRKQYNFNIH